LLVPGGHATQILSTTRQLLKQFTVIELTGIGATSPKKEILVTKKQNSNKCVKTWH